MNILVTGGTGYIGENFIPELLKMGHNVRLLVRNIEKAKKLFEDQCEYFIGDVTNLESLSGCCENIDIVFHMVAKVGNDLPSKRAFDEFRNVNVEGTKNIVFECKKSNIKKFVFVSSIAAIGIVKDKIINEKSLCKPYLPYQVTKYEAEKFLLEEYHKFNFPIIILRPTKVCGVGEHEYSYLSLAKMCKKGFIPKIGFGKNYTSNLYITDLIDALTSSIDNGKLGETYIISSSNSISFKDSINCISSVVKRKPKFIYCPTWIALIGAFFVEHIFNIFHKKPPVTKRNIKAISNDRIYDISKANEDLLFYPKYDMKKIIISVVNWYLEKQII